MANINLVNITLFRKASGLTVLELLITLSIVTILFLLASPGFSNLTANSRLSSSLYSLGTTLRLARAEALSHQRIVVVCGTGNGLECSQTNSWNMGYMSFVEGNPDGTFSYATHESTFGTNSENRQIIHLVTKQPTGTSIKLFGTKNYIRFSGTGDSFRSHGTFSICDDRGDKFAKGIVVTPIGMIKAARDSDSDDIININGGANVSC